MPKLTKRLIDSATCPSVGQVFLRDSQLPGFGLRLTRGSKTFILEKRIQGQMRRITLGAYGPLTVEQARREAHEKINCILNGGDPAQDRRERLHAPTFGDLEKMYLERHAPRKRSLRNDLTMLNKHLAHWRNRRLTNIKRPEMAALHSEIGKPTPYAANRTVALVKKMFNLAKIWGLFTGENPATTIELFPEQKRERFVQPDELPRLLNALKDEPNLYIRNAFLLTLLTGARWSEVLTMKWEHLDLKQGIWRIPQTKNNQPHQVPLPLPVVDLLKTAPRLIGNPYVFPGRNGRKHLVNLSKGWNRIRRRADLKDVRIHDLRRTLGSWLAGSGANLSLIGKALNHKNLSTTTVYARLGLQPVRQALEENAKRMLSVCEVDVS